MPSNLHPNLPVVNKCKKDTTNRDQQLKSSALLEKLAVVATLLASIVFKAFTKTFQEILRVMNVQVGLSMKIGELQGATQYRQVRTIGMAPLESAKRDTFVWVWMSIKQRVPSADIQTLWDP